MTEHKMGTELRATCSCGWKSKKVFSHADVTKNHCDALIDFARHARIYHDARDAIEIDTGKANPMTIEQSLK